MPIRTAATRSNPVKVATYMATQCVRPWGGNMRTLRHAASLLSVIALTAAMAGNAIAQSADDLKNDEKTSGDVLVYGMGYSGNRYTPQTLINKSNVKTLVPKWAFSVTDNRGSETFPLVKDGVIYVTSH